MTAAAALASAPPAHAALLSVDFENAAEFSTSIAQFVDGDDYFFATGGPLAFDAATEVELLAADGAFFAAQDLDGPPSLSVSRQTVTFTEVTLGAGGLTFAVDLAEDDDGTNEDWDEDDFVRFEIALDGGAWQELLTVASTADSRGGDAFNGFPLVNGVELTDAFQTFSVAGISTQGAATAAVRAVIDLDSADEDIAFDNVRLIPAPGSVALLGVACLAGWAWRVRAR
jgi:hypothetical protein